MATTTELKLKRLDERLQSSELTPHTLIKLGPGEGLSEPVFISFKDSNYPHQGFVVLNTETERPITLNFDGVEKVEVLWQSTGELHWLPKELILGPVVTEEGRPHRNIKPTQRFQPPDENAHQTPKKKPPTTRTAAISNRFFDPDREELEKMIPQEVKEKFGMQGFAKLDRKNDKFYPVIVVGPYHVNEQVRDEWLNSFKATQNIKLIVFFYGEKKPRKQFGIVCQRNFFPFASDDERIQKRRHEYEIAKKRWEGGVVVLSVDEEILLQGVNALHKDRATMADLARDPNGHTLRLEEVEIKKTKHKAGTMDPTARPFKKPKHAPDPQYAMLLSRMAELENMIKQLKGEQKQELSAGLPSVIDISEPSSRTDKSDSTWCAGDSVSEQSDVSGLVSTSESARQYNYRPSQPVARVNNLTCSFFESLNIFGEDDSMPPPPNPLRIRLAARGKAPRPMNATKDLNK